MNSPTLMADEILCLLAGAGSAEYLGEGVTRLEQALQAAQLAAQAGADDELINPALLHDVGHLCDGEPRFQVEQLGLMRHEKVGGALLRGLGFPPRACDAVAGHVDAKRYLVVTNKRYALRLSAASMETLGLQGRPVDPGGSRLVRGPALLA